MTKLLYEAYCNEIENDNSSLDLSRNSTRRYNKRFLYKNYKVNGLKEIYYFIFYSLVSVYVKIWLVSLIYYLIQFIISIILIKKYKIKNSNLGFVDSSKAIYDIDLVKEKKDIHLIHYKYHFLCCCTRVRDKYKAFLMTIKTCFFIISIKKDLSSSEYDSLKLHICDMYKLALFYQFVQNFDEENTTFYADSHYERGVYIISNTKKAKFYLIQHGFIRDDIKFKYKFGHIDMLYIYDKIFLTKFEQYYNKIKSYKLIKPNIKLRMIEKNNKVNIFIVSSMNSINYELNLIEKLLKNRSFEIFVKLHPLYNYKDKFYKYFNDITFVEDFIMCDYLITYNSFLGYEYKALNQKVIWLKNYENNIDELIKKLK